MPASTVWPAAVSQRSAGLVGASEPVPARVLGAFPAAVYLLVGDRVLPVVASDALRLPTAVVVAQPARVVGWGVQPGDHVEVGRGAVELPGVAVRGVRTWRPARVPSGAHSATVVTDFAPAGAWRKAAVVLVEALLSGGDVDGRVSVLVGAGGGLTPSGDDVLCGILLGLRLRGRLAEAEVLWRAVRPWLAATTSLSGSLLTEASQGYAVPPVVRLARALAAGDRELAVRAADEVLAIGHTSGADLLAGFAAALDAGAGADPARPVTALEGAHR